MCADRGYDHLDSERIEKAKEKSDEKEVPSSSYAQLTPVKDYCEKVRGFKCVASISHSFDFMLGGCYLLMSPKWWSYFTT